MNVNLACGDLPDAARPNETVSVPVTVENTGSTTATVTVQLLRNGTSVSSEEVTVLPGTSLSQTFSARVGGEPGDYTFTVGTA